MQDDIIGVLDIRGTSDKPFPQHALRMAELLGRQLGLYLSLWKSEKQQRQAFEDLWHQLKSPARHTFKRADDLVRDMNTKWNLSDNSSAENIEKALLKLRGVSRKAKRVAVNAGIFKELASEGRIKIPPEKLIPLKGEEVHQMIIAAGVDTRLMLEEEEEVKFYSPKKGFTELDRHEVKVNFDLLEQAVNCPQHLLWRLTSQRIMRVLGIGTHQGNGVQFRILLGGQCEESPGKLLSWGRPVRRNLKIVGIVELLVIGQPEEAHEHPLTLDDNGHGRGDEIGPIARDDKVNVVHVEELAIDTWNRCRLGLVVIVDQLHRPSNETAFLVDLVAPDLHGQ